MIKKNLANKNVIKAITIGLSAALSLTAPMTDMMAVGAFADPEPGNNEIPASYLPTDALAQGAEKAESIAQGEKNEAVNAEGKAEENKNSAVGYEEASALETTTAGIALTLANLGETAAENAIDKAERAEGYADDSATQAEAAKNLASGAATAGTGEAEAALDVIEDVKTDLLSDDGKEGLSVDYAKEEQAFEDDVEKDINSITGTETDTGLIDETIATDSDNKTDIKVTITTPSGASETKSGAEYATQKAVDANQAALDAKDSLETALTFKQKDEVKVIDGKEVTLADVLQGVTDSVDAASAAYENAKEVLELERAQYNKLVNAYNNFIDEYGLADSLSKLGYMGDYDETPFTGKTKVAEKDELDILLAQLKAYGNTEIANAKTAIGKTILAVGKADTAQKNAVKYANEAIEAAKNAVGYANTTITSAQNALNNYVTKQNAANLALYESERDGKKISSTDTDTSAVGRVYQNGNEYLTITGADTTTTWKLSDPAADVDGNTTTQISYSYDPNATGEFVFENGKLVYKVTAKVTETTTKTTTGVQGDSGKNYANLADSNKLTEAEAKDLALKEAAKIADTNTDTSKSDFGNFVVVVKEVNAKWEQEATYLTYSKQDTGDYNAQKAALNNEYVKFIESKGYTDPIRVDDNQYKVKDGDKTILFKFSVEKSHDNPETSQNSIDAKNAAYSDYLSTIGYSFVRAEGDKVIAKDAQNNEVTFEMSFNKKTEAEKISVTISTCKEIKAGDVIYKRNGEPEANPDKPYNGDTRYWADDRAKVAPSTVTREEYYSIPQSQMTEDGLVKVISWVDEHDGRAKGKLVVYYKLYYPNTEPKDRLEEVKQSVSEKVNNNFALVSGNLTVKKATSNTLTGKGNSADAAKKNAEEQIKKISGAKDVTYADAVKASWDWQFKYSYTYTKTEKSAKSPIDKLVSSVVMNTEAYPEYKPFTMDPFDLTEVKYNKDPLKAADLSGSIEYINNINDVTAPGVEEAINGIKNAAKEADLVAAQSSMSDTLKLLNSAIESARNAYEITKTQVGLAETSFNQAMTVGSWKDLLISQVNPTMMAAGTEPGVAATKIGDGTLEVPYSILRLYVDQMTDKDLEDLVSPDKMGVETVDLSELDEKLYWELDSDGQPTGKVLTESELPTNPGSYSFFVGESFGKTFIAPEFIDGMPLLRMTLAAAPLTAPVSSDIPFTLNGSIYSYTITPPANPIVPSNGPTTPFGGLTLAASGDASSDVTADEDAYVAPVANVTVAGPAVLGARRENEAGGEVLGAKRAMNQAVLGKRRSPETGDSMAIFGWLASLTASLSGAGVAAGSLKKNKKKEEDAE